MFEVILIILLILLLFRIFGKFVLITNFNRMNQSQADFQRRAYEESKRKEGKITIDKEQNLVNPKDAEYVDYEEVK